LLKVNFYHFDLVDNNRKKELQVPTKTNYIGESLFSSLLGIKLLSMPISVCAQNISEVIYSGTGIVDSKIFLADGGAADMYMNLNQDGAYLPIKIPLDTPQVCKVVSAREMSSVGNEISWKVQPTKKLDNVIFKMTTKINFKFMLGVYVRNYFILLGGLIIFLSSLIQVVQTIYRKQSVGN
jgi:hypothetical protein